MAEVCPKRKSGVAKRRGQMALAPTFQRSRGLGPMKRRLLLVLIIWMLCQPTVVVGQEPRRIGEETFISRAIFADGHVWLMSDAGVLLSITEGKDDPVEIALPEAALDLWPEDGQPAVISCSRPSCTEWILRHRSSSGEWNVMARVATLGEHFVTVGKTNGGITVLTHRRIIELAGGKESSIAMSGAWQPKPIASTHVTPTSVFIGFNEGEWGEVSSGSTGKPARLCQSSVRSRANSASGRSIVRAIR